MKKILYSLLLLFLAFAAAGAQTMYDAMRFSENNYYGTAKSIALGNAMTALGGDLGSVGINPAGSAVARCSQFSITPNINWTLSDCDYAPIADMQITDTQRSGKGRFTVPSLGITYNFDTGKEWGLKSYTFGFVANSTSNYLNSVVTGGINSHSSFMGAMAALAMYEGYPTDVLEDFDSYYDTQYAPAWTSVLGYRSNLISSFGKMVDAYYAGASENIVVGDDGVYYLDLGGDLKQQYKRYEVGHKTDMLINFAMNFSDKFFLGVNIGLPIISYRSSDYLSEAAVDPDDFQMGLVKGVYQYNYTADAEGIYGKIGFIWRPVSGLRVGGAIQTPTWYSVSEQWWLNGESYYTDSQYNAQDSSPLSDYSYGLRSPSIFNLGAAYTFGNIGLISIDWERTNYRSMRFGARNDPYYGGYDYYSDAFVEANSDIRKNCSVMNALRIGGEFRPFENWSLRAGYATKSSSDSYSLGCGYSAGNSFFFDFAARMSCYQRKAYYPYDDYLYNDDGTVFASMGAYASRHLYDLVFTFGWRF